MKQEGTESVPTPTIVAAFGGRLFRRLVICRRTSVRNRTVFFFFLSSRCLPFNFKAFAGGAFLCYSVSCSGPRILGCEFVSSYFRSLYFDRPISSHLKFTAFPGFKFRTPPRRHLLGVASGAPMFLWLDRLWKLSFWWACFDFISTDRCSPSVVRLFLLQAIAVGLIRISSSTITQF